MTEELERAECREIHVGTRFVVERRGGGHGSPTVIVKRLRDDRHDPTSAALLHHEWEILQQLDLSAIPRPIAFHCGAGPPVLVMEDAGPENLSQRIAQRPPSIDLFFDVAIQLTAVVAQLHARKLIHHDINPGNVILAADGRVRLVDFTLTGAAHLAEEAAPAQLEGTLPYLSPEQTGRMNRLVDHRADLYGLGVTFYEVLAGAPPFPYDDPLEIVHAHLARAPTPLAVANPKIPRVVSSIVGKLLAKTPEQRYQRAEALLADLQEAHRRWRATGDVEPFELGRVDLACALPFQERIYGREIELAALEAAFDRCQGGAAELILVCGDSGVGKTALIERLRAGITAKGGRMISGKFDLRAANVPYASLVEALRMLVRSVLAEPDVRRPMHRQRAAAVGANGRLLTEIVPDLTLLLGECSPVTPLGPVETENRFHSTLRAFLRSFATAEQPLVLFLDDLQWTDSASLRMLRVLATDPDSRHLLLLGAFRPGEVGPEHPLTHALAEIAQVARVPLRLDLGTLDVEALDQLLCDMLRCDAERSRPLAEALLRKTAGNPFFVRQVLRSVQREGLLTFDDGQDRWTWDMDRIRRISVADNVIKLLVAAICRLAPDAQELVELAACVGKRVELRLLSAVWGRLLLETSAALGTLQAEELMVPAGDERSQGDLVLQFVHDRVQQAAYALLPEERRKELHSRIGRRLLEVTGEAKLDASLFEVVDQQNLGADLLGSMEERVHLARLNHRAGGKAKKSGAYGPALGYFRAGLALLSHGAWRVHHELAFRLQRDAAECAYLIGDHGLCKTLAETGLADAASLLERMDLLTIQVISLTVQGACPEAVRLGRQGLRAFGIDLVERDFARALVVESRAVHDLLGDRAPAALLELPRMGRPEDVACMKLFAALNIAAWFVDPVLCGLVSAQAARFSVEHGHSAESVTTYGLYAACLAGMGQYQPAHAFGVLARDLARQCGDQAQETMAVHVLGTFVQPWREPLSVCVALARRAVELGLQSGELRVAAYAHTSVVILSYCSGIELDRVLGEFETGLGLTRKTGHQLLFLYQQVYRQAIRCLKGLTRGTNRFDDDDFDEQAFLTTARSEPTPLSFYEIAHLQTSFLFRELAAAREHADRAARVLPSVGSVYLVAEHCFYSCLTMTGLCEGATADQRAQLLSEAAAHERRLHAWAESNPSTFRHKHLLAGAELARCADRHLEAARLYDEAIAAAGRAGFRHEEALANELAGRYYNGLGRRRITGLYMSAAIEEYRRWGAAAKARALQAEFAATLADTGPGTLSSSEELGAALDLMSVIKGAEAVSRETSLDLLMDRIMRVCIEAAGAERGALILEEDGAPFLRATSSSEGPVSLERTPLADAAGVPKSVIERVRTTREALVLDDAAAEPSFSSDAYIAARGSRSLMAVPIQSANVPLGTVYFENDQTSHAFTAARCQVIELLATQAGISLQIGITIDKLVRETEERRRAEEAVRFVAEAGAVLAETLHKETIFARLAEKAVPFLADWCVVEEVAEDGQSRRVAATHAAAESCRDLIAEVVRTGQAQSYADAARTAMAVPLAVGGKVRGVILLVSVAQRPPYGPLELAVAEDLAHRASMAIENARLYAEAEGALEARQEFLSIAAHELSTPLASLKLNVSMLHEMSADEVNPVRRERSFQLVDRQIVRFEGLLYEMLDVSRLLRGQIDLTRETVDLAAVAKDVAGRLEGELKRARCELTIRAEAPVVGTWDLLRLEQVVTNLLTNAAKFGAGAPVELIVEGDDADVVRLQVRDHGIGIAPADQQRIFQRFERVASARKVSGFGVGLWVVRQIVEALGGRVGVESAVGEGATFTVELPRR